MTRTRIAHALRVVTAAAVLVTPLAVATGVGASVSGCSTGNISAASGGWERIQAPAFATGGHLVTFAVARSTEGRIFATNGREVDRSIDGGCTWQSVFTSPQVPTQKFPFSASTATITGITTTATARTYLTVADVAHPHVVVSEDAGRTWRTGDTGLLDGSARTRAPQLVASPSPGTLYLLAHGVRVPGGPNVGTDVLFVSEDDAQTWQPRLLVAGTLLSATAAPGFNSIAADPADPAALWAATGNGLMRSTDGGQDWTPIGIGGSDPMSMVSVGHDVGADPRVLTFEERRPIAYRSADGGASWSAGDVPGTADSVATGADARDVAISASGAIYQLARNALAWTNLSRGLPALTAVKADSVHHSSLYACSCDADEPALWRHASIGAPELSPFDSDRSGSTESAADDANDCMPHAAGAPRSPGWGKPSLTPAQHQVVLAPGERRTVHYVFRQPPELMDVFLATTTGPRSEFSYCPFKYGAIHAMNALVQERNLRVGLGGFGDYPTFTDIADLDVVPAVTDDYVYKLERRLGPVDQELYNKIGAQGTYQEQTGPSGDQADLAVLYQAATGVGQIVGPIAAPTYKIAGGLQAGFNDYGYKVIVHVAGNYFHTPTRTPAYPGPDFATVEKALNAHDIHQLGIWINNRYNKQDSSFEDWDGRQDLIEVAGATDSLSPKTLDCDLDGFVDLHRGDPMVCTYVSPAEGDTASHDLLMGLEMQRMLEALHDPQPVRASILAGASAVARLTPEVYPHVDALHGHRFGFDVTYRCRGRDVNQTRLVRLGASVGGHRLAEASASLVCGSPLPVPPAPPMQHPLGLPPLPPPVIPLPVNPGPAPNPVINPAPNPAPAPAQAPQPQPQPVSHPAAVVQMQEQPQLALQRASRELQLDEPMSALPEPSPPQDIARRLMTYTGAALLMCGAALARRFAFAPAYNRRRRR